MTDQEIDGTTLPNNLPPSMRDFIDGVDSLLLAHEQLLQDLSQAQERLTQALPKAVQLGAAKEADFSLLNLQLRMTTQFGNALNVKREDMNGKAATFPNHVLAAKTYEKIHSNRFMQTLGELHREIASLDRKLTDRVADTTLKDEQRQALSQLGLVCKTARGAIQGHMFIYQQVAEMAGKQPNRKPG